MDKKTGMLLMKVDLQINDGCELKNEGELSRYCFCGDGGGIADVDRYTVCEVSYSCQFRWQ